MISSEFLLSSIKRVHINRNVTYAVYLGDVRMGGLVPIVNTTLNTGLQRILSLKEYRHRGGEEEDDDDAVV